MNEDVAQVIEIRFHGLGGEGVVKASNWLGKAAVKCGKWALSFPFFGTEIRGSKVTAFTRISDLPVNMRCYVYEPDILVVTNETIMHDRDVTNGIRPDTFVLLNTGAPGLGRDLKGKIYCIDIDHLRRDASDHIPINTAMLGALSKLIDGLTLESLREVMREEFAGNLLEANISALERGYDSV